MKKESMSTTKIIVPKGRFSLFGSSWDPTCPCCVKEQNGWYKCTRSSSYVKVDGPAGSTFLNYCCSDKYKHCSSYN